MLDHLTKPPHMHVTACCFCTDALGNKGMATSFKDGLLTVLFMDGTAFKVPPEVLNFNTWKPSIL